MREPAADSEIFALLAEFATAEGLLQGVKKVRGAGYRSIDTYSPFPVDGLPAALGFSENRVAGWTLFGGIGGFTGSFGLQYYTNWRYPIEIGGRPLYTWPAFFISTFDLTLLAAALFAIGSMFLLNRLPRLHYPMFDSDNFHFASDTKFFIAIFSNDEKFEVSETQRFLEQLAPQRVDLIRQTEEPE